ncbi:MAG: hypothetical protein A4E62_00169 [Syntrophorhabdus sp. PtaU1.Bin002]|nr:MAG: hypothetical protein A4E58_02083 [Syntrophorhabdus sp. PtaB.Bin006]OPY73902.1 MAG: hypothetical protein A4E62_00169 [Syntrophorhabdus sp. PtaU1.Bin002]
MEELTLGAVSIPARIVRYPDVPACFAFVDVPAEGACSADRKGVHGAKLVEGKAMGTPVRVTVAAKRLPDFDHGLRGVEGAGDSDKIFLAYMEIHGSGLGRLVAQEQLYMVEVAPCFQQVSGKAVS